MSLIALVLGEKYQLSLLKLVHESRVILTQGLGAVMHVLATPSSKRLLLVSMC